MQPPPTIIIYSWAGFDVKHNLSFIYPIYLINYSGYGIFIMKVMISPVRKHHKSGYYKMCYMYTPVSDDVCTYIVASVCPSLCGSVGCQLYVLYTLTKVLILYDPYLDFKSLRYLLAVPHTT